MLSTIINHTIADYALNMVFGGIANNFLHKGTQLPEPFALLDGKEFSQVLVAVKLSRFADAKIRYLAIMLTNVKVVDTNHTDVIRIINQDTYLGNTYDTIGELTMDCMFDVVSAPKWVKLHHTLEHHETTLHAGKDTVIFASKPI